GKLDGGNDRGIAFEVGRYRRNVGNVDHLLRGGDTPKRRVRGRSDQFARARLDIRGRGVVSSNRAEAISLPDVQRADLRLAEAHRVFQHRLEYRLQLARRTADDLQHLGGRRLLLQRFAQLVEQASVLDGDDGLSGEARN